MKLTLGQKAELDALVNFFGGRSMLIRRHERSRLSRSLVGHGLIRFGKVKGGMREHIATAKGIATAKRFKKDWSAIWADKQPPSEPE